MLFFPEIRPEKNNSDKEKVNAASDQWMSFYSFPGLLHFPAPVDIIKNKDRIIIGFGQQLPKVIFGGFPAVISINKSEVYRW